MTRPKPRPKTAVEAIEAALDREAQKRSEGLKPIEIVKVAISAYLAYSQVDAPEGVVESDDRVGLRRGTQASLDRMLFNANYWRAAYEDRIVAACSDPDDARACLKAVSVWTTHTLKLNTLPADEVVATFERFCPPFAINNRRGSDARTGAGKGPVADFKKLALAIAEREVPENAAALRAIVADMEAEAAAYDALAGSGTALDALFAVLPVWILQDRIELVSGGWWDDGNVMGLITDRLAAQFAADGRGEAQCTYFTDSCREAIDAYQRDISAEPSEFASVSVSELIATVRTAREANANSEVEGYDNLPAWLISKEQLIWNTLVCAVYGPGKTRPPLNDIESMIAGSYTDRTDVITEMAHTSFLRYLNDRSGTPGENEYEAFGDQPVDLRNSSINFIRSINGKLEILGYEIMPLGTCYPEQRVTALTSSEVQVLAILEHRRWLKEREGMGWVYARVKDVDAKQSPYLVPWEELPDRAREWNYSAVRSIPSLLASVGLAVAK